MDLTEPAIIILNYNGLIDTINCIKSIEKHLTGSGQLIIIDNNSTDGSFEKLAEYYKNKYMLLKNSKNMGFSGGMNLGIQTSLKQGFKYAILLNNDTEIIENNTISNIVNVLSSKEDVGVVSPMIVNDKRGKVIQNDLIVDSKGLTKLFYKYFTPPYSRQLYDIKPYKVGNITIHEVPMIHGVGFGINLSVFDKTSFFNEDFFCYEEDRDLFLRISNLGYKLMRINSSNLYHKWSGSSGKNSSFVIFHRTRNLWYMRNTYKTKRYIIFAYIKLFLVSIKNGKLNCFLKGILYHFSPAKFKWSN